MTQENNEHVRLADQISVQNAPPLKLGDLLNTLFPKDKRLQYFPEAFMDKNIFGDIYKNPRLPEAMATAGFKEEDMLTLSTEMCVFHAL